MRRRKGVDDVRNRRLLRRSLVDLRGPDGPVRRNRKGKVNVKCVSLGDGVFARREDRRIVLHPESRNGVITDEIALEPETYLALIAFAAKPFKLSRRGQKIQETMDRMERENVEGI